MHHTCCIPGFQIYTCAPVVFYSGFCCCNDWISVVQLFFHLALEVYHYEFFKKKKTSWIPGALYRFGNNVCCYGSYYRMGAIFGNMPHMCRYISDKILIKYKKDKKRVSAPLITLLSVLYLILSI